MVTNQQLYLAIGVPMLFNAAIIGIVVALFNARIDAIDGKFASKFEAINIRLDAIDRRFDDMRDLWRAELHRVEEVLDARLRHIEGR